MRILVLDANQRPALAATRALGRAGFAVITADETRSTLAGASRYSTDALVYPSPGRESEAFLSWVERTAAERRIEALLPITEVTTDLLLRHRARWPSVELPFAPIETVDALSDKVALCSRARRLGVPVPRSVVIENHDDIERAVDEIGFPAILKPRRSRIWRDSRVVETCVRRVADPDDLQARLQEPAFQDFPFLYQERVGGHGAGIFALYRHGKPVAFFSHRRLREKPPEGGVSVLSESCRPDPALLDAARRLLDDANWHGVAMVEFKVDPHEGPFLMEVNARFWGSLQLAIDAGVDFPRLLLDPSAAEMNVPEAGYREGRRLRWLLGDLDRLYLLTRDRHRYGWGRVLGEWAKFVTPHPWNTRHETFRWSDPAPAVRELRQYLAALRGG